MKFGFLLTIEPAAHSRVQTEVQCLDEDLAILEVRCRWGGLRLLLEGLAGDDIALWPLGQHEGERGALRHVHLSVFNVFALRGSNEESRDLVFLLYPEELRSAMTKPTP